MVTLRTEAENIDESQTTLRFAQRAKAVKTKVKDNTVTVLDSAKLLKEVEALPSPNPNPNRNRNPDPDPNPDHCPGPEPEPEPEPGPPTDSMVVGVVGVVADVDRYVVRKYVSKEVRGT